MIAAAPSLARKTPVSPSSAGSQLRFNGAWSAAVPPLDAIKDRVTASVKRQKARRWRSSAPRRSCPAAGGNFAAAAQKAGATVGETARFSRAKPADKLPGDVMVAALEAPAGATTAPIKTAQGYYVLKVHERFAPDTKELGAERDKLSKEVLAKRQGQAWQDWLTATRAGAKIEVTAPRVPPTRG